MYADVTRPGKYLNAKNRFFRKGRKDIIICDFDSIFNISKRNLNIFYISRPAFYKNAGLICDTINIFMEYYDNDRELITCYVNIKTMIDLIKTPDSVKDRGSNTPAMHYSFISFLDDIINRLFSKEMVKKIQFFVEEQYRIDLESSDDNIYKDNPQQFTNKHGKILMALSTAFKLCIPLISHYYVVRNDMVRELPIKAYLYQCFYSIFALFENGTNIYNKIYATVDNAINNSVYSDPGMWNRNKNKSITPAIAKTRITKMVIIDLIYKYTFDAIMINLNYASIRKSSKYLVEGKDTHDYVDINTKRVNNRMSGLEQLEMNAAKVDERDIIIASHGTDNRIKRLVRKYNVEISEKDLDFYKDNFELTQFQVNLILQYFAEDFKGTENMKFIPRKGFYKLAIILKSQLIKDGYKLLPYLLTGNISKVVKGRKVGNKKMTKLKNSPRYKRLMQQYSDVAGTVSDAMIMKHIATFLNTPLTYVDHERPELLEHDIIMQEDILHDELTRFFENI